MVLDQDVVMVFVILGRIAAIANWIVELHQVQKYRMQLVATAWTMTVMGQSTVATLKTVQVNLLVATAANQKAKNAALIASVVQAAAIPKKGADSYIKGRVRNGPAFLCAPGMA